MRFRDRGAAGNRLAERVLALLTELGIDPASPQTRLQVLGLPRGGVPVARPIADALGRPARILLVRKVGLPGHPELAMGALAALGDRIFAVRNADVFRSYGVDEQSWQRIEQRERRELERRAGRFAGVLADDPVGSAVVLVDDGLATGATMKAAVQAVRSRGADPVVIAIPVASRHAVDALTADGVRVVCLTMPEPLFSVGEAYRDFHQLADQEVLDILNQA
jgi:putative phosphoribosyl transferase